MLRKQNLERFYSRGKYSLKFYVSQIPKKTNKNVSIEINNRVSGPRKTVPINVAKR